MAPDSLVLLLSCPDRPGIVRDVTAFVCAAGGNIVTAEQTMDPVDGTFHQRVHFELESASALRESVAAQFAPVGAELEATWSLHDPGHVAPVGLLLSRHSHCLLDLLARWSIGDLPGRPVVVISNHDDHRGIAEGFGLPFHHLPVTAATKPQQEAQITEVLAAHDVELVIMARYMQILSDRFIADHAGRVINIHHSFLPAFPGARPYHQAIARGVKIVGATAHYATADLDEGPIIAQDVARISHRDTANDVVRLGRELENRVLAAAVRAHLHHRVVVTGRRTIVFS